MHPSAAGLVVTDMGSCRPRTAVTGVSQDQLTIDEQHRNAQILEYQHTSESGFCLDDVK